MSKLEWQDWKKGIKDAVAVLLACGIVIAAIAGLMAFFFSYPWIGAAFAAVVLVGYLAWVCAMYRRSERESGVWSSRTWR